MNNTKEIKQEILQIIQRNCFRPEVDRAVTLLESFSNACFNEGWKACDEQTEGLRRAGND